MKEIQNKSASVILWRGLAGRGVPLQKKNRPHMLQTVFVLWLWTLAILPEMMQSWWTRSAARETIVNSLCRQKLSQEAVSDQLSPQTTRKVKFLPKFWSLTEHVSEYIFRHIQPCHFLMVSLFSSSGFIISMLYHSMWNKTLRLLLFYEFSCYQQGTYLHWNFTPFSFILINICSEL